MEVMLSDNTKRLICRAAFLLLCIVPTLLTLRAIVVPPSTADWALRLEQLLGMPAAINRVSTRTPQRTDFINVSIGSDDFDSRLTIDRVTMDNRIEARILTIGTVAGTVEALRGALRRIDEAVDRSIRTDRPLRILIDNIVIHGNEGENSESSESCCLADVTILVETPGDRCSVGFFTGSGSNDKPWLIERTVDKRQVCWRIEAGDSSLPGWFVDEFFPALQGAGANARFSANASLFYRREGWSGQVTDLRISNIDLEEVIWKGFGQPITGFASLHVQSATLVDGRLREMTGELAAEGGVAGARLLEACHQCAEMEIATLHGVKNVEYRQLGLGFRLRNHEIVVGGTAGSAQCVMTATDGGMLLSARSGQPVPVTRVLSLLAWPAGPFNQHTAALIAHLVWPPAAWEGEPLFAPERIAEDLPQVGDSIWR